MSAQANENAAPMAKRKAASNIKGGILFCAKAHGYTIGETVRP